jgi:hypothetical protein
VHEVHGGLAIAAEIGRRGAALVAVTLLAMLMGAPGASAAIALVQSGSVAFQGTPLTTTATLPAGTTAGDLLVATIQDLNGECASNTYSAPAGWVKATSVCRPNSGPAPTQIWYDANVSAGINSVVFNNTSNGARSAIKLTEWSGVAKFNPLDQTGTASSSAGSNTLTVTTAGNPAVGGELAVTLFSTSQGLTGFTPGTGWTRLLTDPGDGLESDYLTNPPSGSQLSETMTTNPGSTFGAVIATFEPACSGGSLTVSPPGSVSFPGLALNGSNASTTTTLLVTADDETGSGSGWNLDATSTTFTNSTHTLPVTATTITSGSAAAGTGNCSLPTNSIGFPVTLPAGSSPPTAVKVFNAAAGTGTGPATITLGAKVSWPANVYAGTYTSTWTLTLASGP